jgi:uncharacterized protein DUF4124
VPRYHRQGQDDFILDKLPDVHASGREQTIDIIVGRRDLPQTLGELQLDVNRNREREGTEATLTRDLQLTSHRNAQARLAVARSSAAQVVLQTFGRALHPSEARHLLHANPAPLFHCGTGKPEAVDHPLLRHKGRMILCLPLSVKRNSKLFRALLHFFALMAIAASALGQVYKWVDERGVTHYGERPPQGRKATEVPDRLASPAPGGAAQGAPKTPSPAPGAATPKDPGPGPRGAPPAKEPDSRPSPPAAETPEDKQRQELSRRQEQCNQQRELLTRLRQSPPSYTLNEKGVRVQVDNSETIARQEKLVVEYCRG